MKATNGFLLYRNSFTALMLHISCRLEISQIRRGSYIQALILAPNFFSMKLILLFTFLAIGLSSGAMVAEKVFVTISLYQAIRVSITVFMPFAVQNIAEVHVCCDRLQVSFDFSMPELSTGVDSDDKSVLT